MRYSPDRSLIFPRQALCRKHIGHPTYHLRTFDDSTGSLREEREGVGHSTYQTEATQPPVPKIHRSGPRIVPQLPYSTQFLNGGYSSSQEARPLVRRRRIHTHPDASSQLGGRQALLDRSARGKSCCMASHALPAALGDDDGYKSCWLALGTHSHGLKRG